MSLLLSATPLNPAWLLMHVVRRSQIMNFYQYRLLNRSKQIDLLYKDGVYIGKRKEGNSIVVLYQLDSFYVKVFYQKYRCYVSQLYCFTSTILLNPYLDQVNVDNMVKC